MTDWKQNLINDARGIAELLSATKTIAVLGIKPETHADQAAFYVSAHMAAAGYGLAEAGIKVVQDRCLMVEEGRLRR